MNFWSAHIHAKSSKIAVVNLMASRESCDFQVEHHVDLDQTTPHWGVCLGIRAFLDDGSGKQEVKQQWILANE